MAIRNQQPKYQSKAEIRKRFPSFSDEQIDRHWNAAGDPLVKRIIALEQTPPNNQPLSPTSTAAPGIPRGPTLTPEVQLNSPIIGGGTAPLRGTFPQLNTGSPSAQELFNTFNQQFQQQYQPLSPEVQQVAPSFAEQGPQTITGLNPEFFKSKRQELTEQLRQEFFGPLGVAQQKASEESAAGRLGSGVGKRILEESVGRPFAQAQRGIERDILQAQLQEQSRVESFNAQQRSQFNETLANFKRLDSANALEAAKADQQSRLALSDMAQRAAQAEAGRLSTEGIAQLESDMEIFKTALQEQQKDLSSEVEFLRILAGGRPISGDTRREEIANQLARFFGA